MVRAKMTRVNLPTTDLAHWAAAMLHERVPANYADPDAQAKCKLLAAAFTKSPWASVQSETFDLDEMLAELLRFARARGYELLDHPPGCYLPAPSVYIRSWGPPEE
jgi:hypothetical protein